MNRWTVLLGCFIGMAVATPALLLQPMALFVKPVSAEFHWSRTQFTTILSFAALLNALVLPLAGYLVDRFGTRRVVLAGTILGCASYAALSQAHSFRAFLALVAMSTLAGNLASYPAMLGLAQRWFDKRLGMALAITSTGLAVGVGSFSYLIATTIAQRGWRAAFLTAGLVALAIGVINAAVLLRDNHGPMPAAEQRGSGPLDVEHDGYLLGAAVRTRDFWLYATASMLGILALVACNFSIPALLSDRGASANQVAAVVAIGSLGSLAGRFFTGFMLDRVSPRAIAAAFFCAEAAGILLFLDGMRLALFAGFLLGIVQGAEIDFLGYVIARRFGRRAYPRIFGTCFAVTLVGAVLGPVAMATIFDRTGSYDLGLRIFPLFPVIAFGLLCLARLSWAKDEAIASSL